MTAESKFKEMTQAMLTACSHRIASVGLRLQGARSAYEAMRSHALMMESLNREVDFNRLALAAAKWRGLAIEQVSGTDELLALKLIKDDPDGRVTKSAARLGAAKELYEASVAMAWSLEKADAPLGSEKQDALRASREYMIAAEEHAAALEALATS